MLENARSSIVVTVSGMSKDVRLLHPENALSGMIDIPSGRFTCERLIQLANAFVGISVVHPNSILQPLPTGPALFSLPPKKTQLNSLMVSGIYTFSRLSRPPKNPHGMASSHANSISHPLPIGPMLVSFGQL